MAVINHVISVTVPFSNVLYLNRYSYSDVRVVLKLDVEQWLASHGHSPHWIMNNPWEAIFDYNDAKQAMLFKLTWG